jgi:hypothetical protein
MPSKLVTTGTLNAIASNKIKKHLFNEVIKKAQITTTTKKREYKNFTIRKIP